MAVVVVMVVVMVMVFIVLIIDIGIVSRLPAGSMSFDPVHGCDCRFYCIEISIINYNKQNKTSKFDDDDDADDDYGDAL